MLQVIHPFIEGFGLDTCMDTFMVIFIEPEGKGGIEILKRIYVGKLEKREKFLPDCSMIPLNFSTRWAIIWFTVY
jgi:hypothetical protein